MTSTPAAQTDRAAEFAAVYGELPTHEVVSPGRVNIIGEHTDYNMLPVLPMAIDAAIRLWIRPNKVGKVRARNVDPAFLPVEFDISGQIPPGRSGEWENYLKAAVNDTFPLFSKAGRVVGFDALVESNLPPASGLSSSSALVVGAYRAFAAVNNQRFDAVEEADMMRKVERYVGTASGGMDQSTIMLGRKGHALLIEFGPLRTRYVPVPDNMVFYAVNSLVSAPKSGSVRFEYNRRTFECLSGMILMRRWMQECGVKSGASAELVAAAAAWQSLRDARQDMKHYGFSAERCCLAALGTDVWSLQRVLDSLGDEARELLREKLLPDENEAVWNEFAGFPLQARVQHVISETNRVWDCVHAFENGDSTTVARLIGESHASCRDLYHISIPELEQLVSDAVACDAMAARITGAGFGGSVVVMCSPDKAESFPENIWNRYFRPLTERGQAPGAKMNDVIIKCVPTDGAHVVELTQ